MRPTSSLSTFCLLAAAASAFKAPLAHEIGAILPRQTTSYDLSFSEQPQGNTATTAATSNNAAATGTQTAKNNGTTTTAIDPRLPAGGLSMITPNVYTTQYYKISDYITFAWNYTSLSVTPSAVDILASCASNSATYTIALNQTITAATQAVTWDTNDFQASASTTLLTGKYTLIIHDAAKDVSATPAAGYLGTYQQFTFGMYDPQPYVSIQDGWQCVTCKKSAAFSTVEKQTMGFVLGAVAMTIVSFTWFAGVAGLW
ncbi:hypothetical protein BAUCODRAFT_37603 [Baudoinia panamericana UAMH 10762]|uniref:DUF7137 domain-containing protein n=1 Tax=Baudoinia panamericana (strain UAMH 10762) TaxID=717646 RepID=M2M8I5_BAUPA|nr:uncharacterized protein BAUCODRAFT_37603 [Baudoinia panamericana UAMH 10762]EMC92701.1 hypothetical protein BAUCODRAFT_37603 [Baudoinia panamericana UAMH 10762]